MANAGYSSTSLLAKLGIKPEMKVWLLNAPTNYFELIGVDISNQLVTSNIADIIHLFVISKSELYTLFLQIISKCPSNTIIWISWYKKSSKQPTDITEDIIREIVLPTGWVDIKVCAVSEQWSGLKIVIRKKRIEKYKQPKK